MRSRILTIWFALILFAQFVHSQNFELLPNSPGNTHILSFKIDAENRLFCGADSALYRSINGGETWEKVFSLFGNDKYAKINAICFNDSGHVFIGTDFLGWSPSSGPIGGLFRSKSNGDEWEYVFSPADATIQWADDIMSLSIDSTDHIVMGTLQSGVYISKNTSWGNLHSWYTTLPFHFQGVNELVVNSKNQIIAGSYWRSCGLIRIASDRQSWQNINEGLTDSTITALSVNQEDGLFAGTPHSLFRSLDDGDHWEKMINVFSDTLVGEILVSQENSIFASTIFGIYRSEDDGDNWVQIADVKFDYMDINSDGFLFGCRHDGKIYKSLDPTVVQVNRVQFPDDCIFMQNYPNPFNQSTRINIELPEQQDMHLSVVNQNGQIVKDIFSGKLDPGVHSFVWCPENISSGIYFFQLHSNKYNKLIKCILMK